MTMDSPQHVQVFIGGYQGPGRPGASGSEAYLTWPLAVLELGDARITVRTWPWLRWMLPSRDYEPRDFLRIAELSMRVRFEPKAGDPFIFQSFSAGAVSAQLRKHGFIVDH